MLAQLCWANHFQLHFSWVPDGSVQGLGQLFAGSSSCIHWDPSWIHWDGKGWKGPLPLLIAVRSTDCRLLDVVALVAAFGSSWLLVPLESLDLKMFQGCQVASLLNLLISIHFFYFNVCFCHLSHILSSPWPILARRASVGRELLSAPVASELVLFSQCSVAQCASPMTLTSMM